MDYKNGKIYIIRNHINDMVYIGSTTQPLHKRICWHKCNGQKYRLHRAMEELGRDNFYIELLEKYPCESKEEFLVREGHYIRQFDSFKNGYNGVVAGRTMAEWRKEYYQQNKEELNKKGREYQKKHLDEIREKRSVPFKCECGAELTIKHKARHFKSLKHLNYLSNI